MADEAAIESKLEAEEAEEAEEHPAEAEHDGDEDEDGDGDTKPADVSAALSGLQAAKERRSVKKLMGKKKKLEKNGVAAKGKAGTKKSTAADGNPLKGIEEASDFDVQISTSTRPPLSRDKHCLDDFLCCLNWARTNLKVGISEEESNRTKRFLISLFLELAWSGSTSVNGKTFSTYAAFREEAQKMFWAANQKLHVGTDAYDPLDLANNLLKMVGVLSNGHSDIQTLKGNARSGEISEIIMFL